MMSSTTPNPPFGLKYDPMPLRLHRFPQFYLCLSVHLSVSSFPLPTTMSYNNDNDSYGGSGRDRDNDSYGSGGNNNDNNYGSGGNDSYGSGGNNNNNSYGSSNDDSYGSGGGGRKNNDS